MPFNVLNQVFRLRAKFSTHVEPFNFIRKIYSQFALANSTKEEYLREIQDWTAELVQQDGKKAIADEIDKEAKKVYEFADDSQFIGILHDQLRPSALTEIDPTLLKADCLRTVIYAINYCRVSIKGRLTLDSVNTTFSPGCTAEEGDLPSLEAIEKNNFTINCNAQQVEGFDVFLAALKRGFFPDNLKYDWSSPLADCLFADQADAEKFWTRRLLGALTSEACPAIAEFKLPYWAKTKKVKEALVLNQLRALADPLKNHPSVLSFSKFIEEHIKSDPPENEETYRPKLARQISLLSYQVPETTTILHSLISPVEQYQLAEQSLRKLSSILPIGDQRVPIIGKLLEKTSAQFNPSEASSAEHINKQRLQIESLWLTKDVIEPPEDKRTEAGHLEIQTNYLHLGNKLYNQSAAWAKILGGIMLFLLELTVLALCCATLVKGATLLPIFPYVLNQLIPTAIASGLFSLAGLGIFNLGLEERRARAQMIALVPASPRP